MSVASPAPPAHPAGAGARGGTAAGTAARTGAAAGRRRGALSGQLRSELSLVFHRRRNLILLGLLAGAPVLIGVAVKASQPRPGEGPPFLTQVSGNGLFLAFTALSVTLPVFLPLAIAVVSGDAVAGEAQQGTLRYLLTVPVSRARLLAVKTAGVVTFSAAAVLAVTVVGVVTGAVLFGLHDVTLLSGQVVSLGNGMLRALGVAGFVLVDLLGLAGVGLLASTFTEVPVGAMAATVGVAIISAVLDQVSQLGSLRGALLTHHWLDFADLLRGSADVPALLRALAVPLLWAAVCYTAAWARITTADHTA